MRIVSVKGRKDWRSIGRGRSTWWTTKRRRYASSPTTAASSAALGPAAAARIIWPGLISSLWIVAVMSSFLTSITTPSRWQLRFISFDFVLIGLNGIDAFQFDRSDLIGYTIASSRRWSGFISFLSNSNWIELWRFLKLTWSDAVTRIQPILMIECVPFDWIRNKLSWFRFSSVSSITAKVNLIDSINLDKFPCVYDKKLIS